ncbi:MAG: HAD family hydrolase [Kineothrix sp.]
MRFQSLLFDLDGTLTDPKEGITSSVQYALRAFGIEVADLDKLTPFIGPPLRDSFRQFYGFDEERTEAAVAKYREYFSDRGIFQNEIYPGIRELLGELEESGRTLAVASSKPQVFVERILRYFDIYDCFSVIVGSGLDGSRENKEAVVEEVLRQLDGKGAIDRADAVMIGDRKFDIAGGKAYGLRTIGVGFGYAQEGELEAAGADYIAATVEELRRILIG